MRRYARYKPTGIPWLPEVPEEWEVRRARYLFKKEQRPVRPDDDIVTAFRDGQVTLRKNRRTTGFTEATDYSHYQGIRKGDLVIHQMDAFAGCAGVSDSNGMGTPVLSVCTPIRNDVNVHYVAHIVRLMGRNGYIQSLARGIRERSCDFRFETFARQLLPLPPLAEQKKIAAFLDEKCGKVDRLVAAKEKEVALLKELKQSMIAEAVTGRTNNRPMKPSGIPWLPELPVGWEVKRARYLFKREQRPTRPGDEIITAFRDGQVTLRKNRRVTGFTEATDYSHYQGVRKGDLVIHQMDAFAGCAGVSDSDGMGTPVLSVCTPLFSDVDVMYYAQIVRLMGRNGFIQSLARGIRERSADFRFETFARQYLPLPPLPEQREIVAYIEARAAKIDAAVGKLEAEVAALKEYRERLVADVVTGQRKVA